MDKVSGKSALLKTMLIKAWRERWSASQYGTQVKSLLGRGVSGDVYCLSDSLISQAMTGPAPNQLILSLLHHSLATQLVSHAATLATVARFSGYGRPHCTAALLDLVTSQAQYMTCRSRPEECVSLSTSLLSLATWTLRTLSQTVTRLTELRDSPVDATNLSKCLQVLTWLTSNKFISCLLVLAKHEDQDQHQELLVAAKTAAKSADQVYMFSNQATSLQNDIMSAVSAVRSLDPTSGLVAKTGQHHQSVSLVYTLHSMLAFEALLRPTSDLSQLAAQLHVIQTIKNIALSDLLCEIFHCCLLAMNEKDGLDVLKWDSFTFIRLPHLVGKLVKLTSQGGGGGQAAVKQEQIKNETGTAGAEVFKGLSKLLDYQSLLNTTDARCRHNVFDLVCKSMMKDALGEEKLLTESEYQQLVARRVRQLDTRKHLDLKMEPGDSRDVIMMVKADTTIGTIIQTFENRSCEQGDFEALLNVMYHIVKGSSFDLLLVAASASGMLPTLITKLLEFNEGSKESMGESIKGSQTRAALFDLTFLMLIYAVQCFDSDTVLAGMKPGFFHTWARECMLEEGRIKSLYGFQEQESQVDSLLQQINTGEIRTQVIKWHNVMNNIHGVMKEIILGCEMGAIAGDKYNRLTATLCSRLCCLPVCITSWLSSYAHYTNWTGWSQTGGGGKPVSPVDIADRFLNVTSDSEEESLPYLTQRVQMMASIMKKMREELSSHKSGRGDSCLSSRLADVWDRVWTNGRLDLVDTRRMAELFETGGAVWYVEVMVEKMVGMVYNTDMDKAVEVVFSLMHVDMAACMIALVVHVLPRYLATAGQEDRLAHPAGSALARLTVMVLSSALQDRPRGVYAASRGKRSARAAMLDELANSSSQPVKLRRLTSGLGPVGGEEGAAPGGAASYGSQQELLDNAHSGLFTMLSWLGAEACISPRSEFVCCFLEQCVLAGREQARVLLGPAPLNMVMQLVKLLPGRFSMEMILSMYDLASSGGRKNAARILCMLRNIRAKETAEEAES